MFRIVRDFVKWPSFLIVCDCISCGVFLTKPVPQFDATVTTDPTASFVEDCKQAGWQVGLDQQICPEHAKAIRQYADREKLIHLPEGMSMKN